jgi:hypothetical protein
LNNNEGGSMSKSTKSVNTFINPAGLIEQHYFGVQNGITVGAGVREANKQVQKFVKENKPPLMLVDLTEVKSTNIKAHIAAARGMKQVPFRKIAVYAPANLQILINTLAIVSDKKKSVKAFDSRFEALEWLQGGAKP